VLIGTLGEKSIFTLEGVWEVNVIGSLMAYFHVITGGTHYSRTCWEPEEIIDRKERDHLARVDVRLEPGSCALQVGNGQALRHAKVLLVGMAADTTRS
jgi:hypothetical protein